MMAWQRCLVVWVLTGVLTGCMTTRAVDLPSSDLCAQIRAGHLIVPGDEVTLVTSDQRQHHLQVETVDRRAVRGSGQSVPIDDIVALRIRKVSASRTLLLTAGIVGGVYLVLYLFARAIESAGFPGFPAAPSS